MADFRKVTVLAALVLLLGLVSTASAQTTAPFSCTATAAVPPTLRAEGMTELVGDIVIDCTGGTSAAAGAALPTANFSIFLNTNITSKLVGGGPSNYSEALLLIDEPGAGAQVLCSADASFSAATGTCTPATAPATGPNAYQGIVNGNRVDFNGIPVNPPGTTGHRVFRITNIRANASGISAGPSGTPGTIQALISISGSTSVPLNNPTQTVGFVQNGLTFNLRLRSDLGTSPNSTTDIALPQCNSLSRTDATKANRFGLQFTENFPTAFKTAGTVGQNVPGTIYNTESGFTLGTTGIGLANSGTRLKAVFNNIPAGVSIYVSNANVDTASTATAQLVSSEGSIGVPVTAGTATDFPCIGAGCTGTITATQLIPVNGSATAVWEVTGANSLAAQSYNMGVFLAYTANAAQNSPAPGTGTVTGGFAPSPSGLGVTTTAAATASSTLPIPRFIDPTQTKSLLTIFACRTNLLFPFVTNQAGFDTGIAISNTSTDPFGTATQSGACTLNAYGANAPAAIPTGNIATGTSYVTLASTVMPNFQGYVISTCNFQFAHGFAFISDFGARNLAMGYLALIIPEPGVGSRSSTPFTQTAGGGEALGF